MRRLSLATILAVGLVPLTADAQFPAPRQSTIPDGTLGLEMSILEARGDFRPGNRVSVGYGVRGALGWGPRRAFDLGVAYRSVAHDSKKYHDTLEVKNMLRTLAVSARYTLPIRYARPYIGASAGAAYFGTETTVESCCDDEGDRYWSLSDIRLGRFAPMASTRIGMVIDLMRMPGTNPTTLSADLGMETHHGGRVAYQVSGRGEVRRTGTSYRVYSLGVSVRTR
jgi:hypothetical protein